MGPWSATHLTTHLPTPQGGRRHQALCHLPHGHWLGLCRALQPVWIAKGAGAALPAHVPSAAQRRAHRHTGPPCARARPWAPAHSPLTRSRAELPGPSQLRPRAPYFCLSLSVSSSVYLSSLRLFPCLSLFLSISLQLCLSVISPLFACLCPLFSVSLSLPVTLSLSIPISLFLSLLVSVPLSLCVKGIHLLHPIPPVPTGTALPMALAAPTGSWGPPSPTYLYLPCLQRPLGCSAPAWAP